MWTSVLLTWNTSNSHSKEKSKNKILTRCGHCHISVLFRTNSQFKNSNIHRLCEWTLRMQTIWFYNTLDQSECPLPEHADLNEFCVFERNCIELHSKILAKIPWLCELFELWICATFHNSLMKKALQIYPVTVLRLHQNNNLSYV